jgi:hypothetical protein
MRSPCCVSLSLLGNGSVNIFPRRIILPRIYFIFLYLQFSPGRDVWNEGGFQTDGRKDTVFETFINGSAPSAFKVV